MSSEFELNTFIYDTIFRDKHTERKREKRHFVIDDDEKNLIIVFAAYLLDSILADVAYDVIFINYGHSIDIEHIEFIKKVQDMHKRFKSRFDKLFELLNIENCEANIVLLIRSCLVDIFGVTTRFLGEKVKFSFEPESRNIYV